MSIHWQARVTFTCNDRQQLLDPFAPLRSHNAELSHMRSQGIDQLGPLPHQKIARSMLHQLALLLGRFSPYKTHRRPPHRFADRRGIGSIVLVALDVGLHILRRHQPYLMAKLRELTRPVMSRGAGFHADKARRQGFEERQYLAAPQLLANDDPLGRVDPVNLKHVLCDIQTDRGNLHVDGSPQCGALRRNHPMALRCRERAPSTTSIANSCTAKYPPASPPLRTRGGFATKSGRAVTRPVRPLRANRDQMARSKNAYSITSSAIESTAGGTSMLSARAVCRLMTNSNLVSWSTGSSAGFSPLRILPAYTPTSRNTSARSVP